MNMKELKTTLSAALNMIKGFCYNGRLCNGWREINENVIEFRYTDNGRTTRVNLNDIESIGKCSIYDERNGFNKPYPNVITVEH